MDKMLTGVLLVATLILVGCNNGTTGSDFPEKTLAASNFERMPDQNILGNRFHLLRHRTSGNCYASYDGASRQVFSQVTCADFVK
ncbi:hypothetical protein VP424E501_P0220 [Vibrio phage 424E50-1]|nr:hypothetical protein VP424E501_P0220 [Vibrio phage 424E50-1]